MSTSGKMEEFTRVIGNKITCMDKVFTSGQMVENTKAATLMIKKKVMEFTHILTGAAIKETGTMVSNMAREYS